MKDKPNDKPQAPDNELKLKPDNALAGMNLADMRQLNQSERTLSDGFALSDKRSWLNPLAFDPPADSGVELLKQAVQQIARRQIELS